MNVCGVAEQQKGGAWSFKDCDGFTLFQIYLGPDGAEAGRRYAELAREWGITPLQLALAWAPSRSVLQQLQSFIQTLT